jgi:hypothetical protein
VRTKERGAVAVVVAIVLAVLVGFLALSLETGHNLSVRGELQNGADAAALAGARRLDCTTEPLEGDPPPAILDAQNFAHSHPTDTYAVEPFTIQLGHWASKSEGCDMFGGTDVKDTLPGPDGHHFCEIPGRSEADAANISAVRVVTNRQGAPGGTGGGAVAHPFGAFVGEAQTAVAAEAIALAGGPPDEQCPELPIVIRAGCLFKSTGGIQCDANGVGKVYFAGLSSALEDTAGLTSLNQDPASANRVCEILRRPRDCSARVTEGADISIQEGTSWNSNCSDGCTAKEYHGLPNTANDSICEVIRRLADRDCDGKVDVDAHGKPSYRARVPIVQYPGESLRSCEPGDHYNQSAKVVGWATVAVVSARCGESAGTKNNELPIGSPITALCDAYMLQNSIPFSSSTSCVAIQLFCEEEAPRTSGGGGGCFGTAAIPVLVH